MSEDMFPGAVNFDVKVAISIRAHGAIPYPTPVTPMELGLESFVSVGGQLVGHTSHYTTEYTEHLR